MKIIITKSSGPECWYDKLKYHIFDVVTSDFWTEWKVKDAKGETRRILYADAVLLNQADTSVLFEAIMDAMRSIQNILTKEAVPQPSKVNKLQDAISARIKAGLEMSLEDKYIYGRWDPVDAYEAALNAKNSRILVLEEQVKFLLALTVNEARKHGEAGV